MGWALYAHPILFCLTIKIEKIKKLKFYKIHKIHLMSETI